MKIAFCHPSAEMYGSDKMAYQTCLVLRDQGHQVRAILPSQGQLVDALEAAGIPVDIFPMPVLRKSIVSMSGLAKFAASSANKLLEAIRHPTIRSSDAVYVNTVIQPHWLLVGRATQVKVVAHVHEAEHEFGRLKAGLLYGPLRLADLVICNSKASLEVLRATHIVPMQRACVVHNGIELADFASYGVRNASSRCPRILIVGRISPRKGQGLAVSTIEELRARGYDASLRVAGSAYWENANFESELRDQIKRLGLDGSVELLGFIPKPSLLYGTADIALVPSRVESFGLSAVEAMAAGVPVVVADVQGLGEIVEHHVSGLKVAGFDPHDWADAIEELLDDPDLYNRLSGQGRDQALSKYSSQAYAKRLELALHGLSKDELHQETT